MYSRCVLRSRLQLLNALIGPVVGATDGATWKGHRVGEPGKQAQARRRSDPSLRSDFRMADAPTPEAKEEGLLRAFGRIGVKVRTVPKEGTPAPSDTGGASMA